MKISTKKLALALAAVMTLSTLAAGMMGCQPAGGNEETVATDAATSPSTQAPANPSESKIDHAVTVLSAGGMALPNVNVYVYNGEDLLNYGTTDESGRAVIALPRGEGYTAVLSGLPAGYQPEASYALQGVESTFSVTSAVIDNKDHSGLSYKVGDVIRDFTVTDTEGNVITLSELLKTRDMVLINFWYTTCSWCVKEFPYMNSAYEKYKDKVEIVALNHYSSDSAAAIKSFRDNFFDAYDDDPETSGGLSFPMAQDFTGMGPAFINGGYPTSVVVDRYGVVCLIEEGGIVSETPFINLFEHFTAENYQQKLLSSIDELTPVEKPNVSQPSSEELSNVFDGGKLTVTYHPETEDENAESFWPFVITEKNGTPCIKPANAFKEGSYAILYADVELKAGQALAFDYWSSTEQAVDLLYTLVDRKDIYQISGEGDGWNTCFTYVAPEDGVYEVAFCYAKDASDSVGEDTVYLKNLRVVDVADINIPTYIPRYAATHPAADGYGYEQYISVVFNETDGYYHVGTADGPILLVNLMQATQFSNQPIYTHAYNGEIVLDGVNYYDQLVDYCNYASNSSIYGLCSVNEELKQLLEKVAAAIGLENENPNQWLQMCSYYDAYGTGGTQLMDPIKGLATHSAFPAVEGENSVTYDRMIMPRGLYYKFTPAVSGAYRITSHSEYEVEGWIFLDDLSQYYLYEPGERLWNDDKNLSMVVYMEAGTNYYIDIAYYDVYQTGTFTFDLEFLGETYDHFTLCSPGYFIFPDGEQVEGGLGELAQILTGGIDVALGDDGYYHHVLEDGTLGSVIYADFVGYSLFNYSIAEMIDRGAFNLALTEGDMLIRGYMEQYGDGTREKLKEIWGESFDEYAELYQLDEVLAGKTHGHGPDRTAEARAYLDQLISDPDRPELEGCVAVDAELAELLMTLMNKYTFANVENSFIKLCFYYQYLGA